MTQKPVQRKKGDKTLFYAVIIFAIVSFFVSFAFFSFENINFRKNISFFQSKSQSKIIPTSTPTPLPAPRPIDHGQQIYNVSTGQGSKGPSMTQIIFEPMDPKIGENQKLSVKAQNATPIISIILTLKTDHKSSTYPLQLKEGATTGGTWEASWKVEDTYDYAYVFSIEAADAKEKSKLEYPWR